MVFKYLWYPVLTAGVCVCVLQKMTETGCFELPGCGRHWKMMSVGSRNRHQKRTRKTVQGILINLKHFCAFFPPLHLTDVLWCHEEFLLSSLVLLSPHKTWQAVTFWDKRCHKYAVNSLQLLLLVLQDGAAGCGDQTWPSPFEFIRPIHGQEIWVSVKVLILNYFIKLCNRLR